MTNNQHFTQALKGLNEMFSKVSVECPQRQTMLSNITKDVLLEASTNVYISPEQLLAVAYNKHGKEFMMLVNPQLREDVLEFVRSIDVDPPVDCDRLWGWLHEAGSRELMKARSLKSILNTIKPFCAKIVQTVDEVEVVSKYLRDIVITSSEVAITPQQFSCLRHNSKIKNQDQLLSSYSKTKFADLKERIYPGKITMEPVAFESATLQSSQIGKFVGKKGAKITEFQNKLQASAEKYCPHCNITVNVSILEEEDKSKDVEVVIGAWVTDDDLSTRFANRKNFDKVIAAKLSVLFEVELRNSAKQMKISPRRAFSTSNKRIRCY